MVLSEPLILKQTPEFFNTAIINTLAYARHTVIEFMIGNVLTEVSRRIHGTTIGLNHRMHLRCGLEPEFP
jgi:hypothetical protein